MSADTAIRIKALLAGLLGVITELIGWQGWLSPQKSQRKGGARREGVMESAPPLCAAKVMLSFES